MFLVFQIFLEFLREKVIKKRDQNELISWKHLVGGIESFVPESFPLHLCTQSKPLYDS